MPANRILEEAWKLHTVSESLHSLAEQNEGLSAALTTLAGTVRSSATLLEVLVALRVGSDKDVESKSN